MKYAIVALILAFAATDAAATVHPAASAHHERRVHHPVAFPPSYAAAGAVGTALVYPDGYLVSAYRNGYGGTWYGAGGYGGVPCPWVSGAQVRQCY